MLKLFLQCIIIGIAVAAPVGPIGVLCINRSLHDGWKLGFATGFGAAMADGTYGAIAAFSLTFISAFLIQHATWIKLIGGLFLIYLGTTTLLRRPPKQLTIEHPNTNLFVAAITTFFLTLLNPMTILAFIAIFTALGVHSHVDYMKSFIMVCGVIIGSLAWWMVLSCGVAAFFRHRVQRSKLYWVNFISGALIVLFGFIALISINKIWRF